MSRGQVAAAMIVATLVAFGCGRRESSTKEQYLASGDRYAQQGKYGEAVIEYRNALKLDPKFGDARYHLAQALEKSNDLRNAFGEFIRAADLLPGNAEAQLKAGHLLLAAGRYEDARTRAQAVIATDPKNVEAQILKGYGSAGLKDVKGAIEEIQNAMQLAPSDDRPYATLGMLKVTQGKQSEAEAAFKQAVTVNPTSVNAHLALASFDWSIGRMKEAEDELKRAIEIDPKHIVANRALAMLLVSSRRPAEAEAPLKNAVANSGDTDSKLALADYYLTMRRGDEGRQILTGVAAAKEGYAPASIRLAVADYLEGHRAEAHKRLDEILARDAKYGPALLAKSRFLMAEGKGADAVAPARAAVAADASSAAAQFMLGTVLQSQNDVPGAIAAYKEVLKLNPRAAAAELQLAQLTLETGGATAAVEFAEQGVRDSANSPAARLLLARALTGRRDFARAQGVLADLLRAFPNQPPVHTEMARFLMAKQDRPGARREYERALELDASSLEALSGLVALDISDKNLAGARARLEPRLRERPNDVLLLLVMQGVQAAAGDVKGQEATLRQIVSIDPGNMQAFDALAALYFRTKRIDEAIAEYRKIAKAQPKSEAAPTLIGILLEAQNKTDEARQTYEQIVAANPSAALASNNLAWLYAEHGGNLDVALQLAQAAKQRLSNLPQVNDTLGWVYYKKDLPQMAIAPLMESVAADPQNAVYPYHLGLAYAKAGQKAKARQALDEALRRKPGYPEAEAARRELR